MIVVDFWGDYACFTPPYAKVERMTLPAPTPSVIRNMLQAVYGKPQEFWWQVLKIEVMRPLAYYNCKRNEVNKKMSNVKSVLDVSDPGNRAQHTTVFLKDVKYRITAEPVARDPSMQRGIDAQAWRRIEHGQCFSQPYFGLRECAAYFSLADMTADPVRLDLTMGLVPYDVHDPTACEPGFSGMSLSLFQCEIRDGAIDVPRWGDSRIVTLEGGVPNAQGIV